MNHILIKKKLDYHTVEGHTIAQYQKGQNHHTTEGGKRQPRRKGDAPRDRVHFRYVNPGKRRT